ncbi:MAG: nucleotide exchange factor GrpE [Candidatus Scalindua sp. AMX11]|nr:MAG: nucleotide exchange factor GrpE [Candidatus Scalindua sp.]NOG83017.1 nucleotide exchange factor GrpE [Planctomycetota bacterium]RZV79581.1 MAG: nucleotide exchange factor GrpE [Candidatus Scalindua sp. SCAELEC01]TDE65222.1 MAG: nucleotide exchange factor GrpE [Candidatus Scalindua sp. AMX11]GJQ58541.1 MAG: nucleotide exchange factor GrpE [Candidatus Scalindua sp.]
MSKVKNDNDENREEMRNDHEDAKQHMNSKYQELGEEGGSVSGEDTELQSDDEGDDIEEQLFLTKDEVDVLRKKAADHDSVLDQLLRTRAEFANYQKRMRKELESARNFSIQELVLDLFPEIDNFERALKHAEDSDDLEKFIDGVRLIENQLLKVLGKYGVTPIEPVGKPFDPNLHEAVVEEENNDLPHHTVTEEFQQGFLLKERVIRPSKVKVSKRTVDEDETEGEADEVSYD